MILFDPVVFVHILHTHSTIIIVQNPRVTPGPVAPRPMHNAQYYNALKCILYPAHWGNGRTALGRWLCATTTTAFILPWGLRKFPFDRNKTYTSALCFPSNNNFCYSKKKTRRVCREVSLDWREIIITIMI